MSDIQEIRLTVNGQAHTLRVPARKLLADCLREDLRLTGTHIGCEQGVCGACTILLDGEPVRSCLMFAFQAEDASIETVESFGSDADELHPIQQAFWEHHGLQCGFCTPGMLMTAKALLAENPSPSDEEIRYAIAGNVCRCTGYVNIVESISAAAKELASKERVDA